MISPRTTNLSRFDQILSGFSSNTSALLRAQQQIASGLRFTRPSDDPAAAARAILLERRVAESERFGETAASGRGYVDATASTLGNASDIVNTLRATMVQSMNGTLAQTDRDLLANQIDLMREELLGIANFDFDKRFVFGGSATGSPPWEEVMVDGVSRVRYRGSDESVEIQVGASFDVKIGTPGTDYFARRDPSGLELSGLTGAAVGSSPNQGSGYERLEFRVDLSRINTGLIAAGVDVVDGGEKDTALGISTVNIDAVAGTIQMGSGEPVPIPDPGSPEYADLVVTNEKGGTLHLDLTGWSGGSVVGTSEGLGSVSVDGRDFTAIDFTSDDFELESESGSILHLDMTNVRRAGTEVANFGGTVNLFDALEGFSRALRNEDGIEHGQLLERMNTFLGEFDRNADHVRNGLAEVGARSAQLASTEDRLSQSRVQMSELLSEVRDTDFSEAILNMTQAETLLQVAQSSGARILQNTLLNFLR